MWAGSDYGVDGQPGAADSFLGDAGLGRGDDYSRPAERARPGLRPANLRQSVWVAAAALAFAAVAVWIAAERHTLHEFEFTMLAGWRFWGYVVWTFVQQFLLQDYFLFRLLRLLPNKRMAIVTAALLFAGAHIPNPLLMVATLVWGILACVLFLRYRDLYSLGLAQGVLGICIAVTIPGAMHHEMYVGRGYYDYRHHARSSALSQPKRPDRVTDA